MQAILGTMGDLQTSDCCGPHSEHYTGRRHLFERRRRWCLLHHSRLDPRSRHRLHYFGSRGSTKCSDPTSQNRHHGSLCTFHHQQRMISIKIAKDGELTNMTDQRCRVRRQRASPHRFHRNICSQRPQPQLLHHPSSGLGPRCSNHRMDQQRH